MLIRVIMAYSFKLCGAFVTDSYMAVDFFLDFLNDEIVALK